MAAREHDIQTGNRVKDEQGQAEAKKLYRMAAEKGSVEAQMHVALGYALGIGVEENYKESVKWFRKAADQGDAEALAQLAWRYEDGVGVEKNIVEGYKCALLSLSRGNEVAHVDVKRFEKRLSPEERAEGQNAATKWQREFEKTSMP